MVTPELAVVAEASTVAAAVTAAVAVTGNRSTHVLNQRWLSAFPAGSHLFLQPIRACGQSG
jgi:hypothetical protein